MRDLSKLLNPDDKDILSSASGINWIPKETSNVILPYIEEVEESSDFSTRREQTKEVISKYREIIAKCSVLEAQIESRCKNVKVSISPKNNMRTIEAMARVFGVDATEITFEHYKKCVAALADINNKTPSLVD